MLSSKDSSHGGFDANLDQDEILLGPYFPSDQESNRSTSSEDGVEALCVRDPPPAHVTRIYHPRLNGKSRFLVLYTYIDAYCRADL